MKHEIHVYTFGSCNVAVKAFFFSKSAQLLTSIEQEERRINNFRIWWVCSTPLAIYTWSCTNRLLPFFFDRFKTLWWSQKKLSLMKTNDNSSPKTFSYQILRDLTQKGIEDLLVSSSKSLQIMMNIQGLSEKIHVIS